MLILSRDGKQVFSGSSLECIRYIHENHCYSFTHALKWEGYSLSPA